MMAVVARVALAVLIAVGVVACADDDSAEPAATESPSTAQLAPLTAPVASPPSTTASATNVTAPDTTEVCPETTSGDPVNVGYPMQMTSLVGTDIRTGAHPCFERVVLELAGNGGLPGYQVAYESDPIALSPSDQAVEIAGDATLVLRVAAWMTTMEGEGYQGPTDLVPSNVEHIVELRMIENFEGMSAWAIGLDEQRPFTVVTLAGPPRIVLDIAAG